jgi:hypothetical protein
VTTIKTLRDINTMSRAALQELARSLGETDETRLTLATGDLRLHVEYLIVVAITDSKREAGERGE